MGSLFFKRYYPVAALVFSGGMLVAGMAHADSAAQAKRQQLLQQQAEVEKQTTENKTQLNNQNNQYLKESDNKVQKLNDWNADQIYANGKKCFQLQKQGQGDECNRLNSQQYNDYNQKMNLLLQDRQQHEDQFNQQDEDLGHQEMLKIRQISEELNQL